MCRSCAGARKRIPRLSRDILERPTTAPRRFRRAVIAAHLASKACRKSVTVESNDALAAASWELGQPRQVAMVGAWVDG